MKKINLSLLISVFLHGGLLVLLLSGDRHCCHAHLVTPMAVEWVAHDSDTGFAYTVRSKTKRIETDPRAVIDPDAEAQKADSEREETATAQEENREGQQEGANAPASGSAAALANRAADEISQYLGALIGILNQHKVYPRDAMERDEEGNVVIAVTVEGDGSVHSWRVESPCPFENLNQAALKAIQRAGRFPPLPAGVGAPAHFHIPIKFEIRR